MNKGNAPFGAAFRAACLVLLLLSTSVWADRPGLMLSYSITHDLLRTADHFTVDVYEDGVALAHYPAYMEAAGDYAVQLTPSEVQGIRLLLEHPLVQGFDPGQARAEKAAVDAQSSALFAISDDSHSQFDFELNGKRRQIRWTNLEIDARRYPEIGVFRKLADIEAGLRQLDQHPTAQPVSD